MPKIQKKKTKSGNVLKFSFTETLKSKFTPTKRRLSACHLPILEPMLKPALPSYTIYSISFPPSHPRHFIGLLRASRDSAIHVLLVYLYFWLDF